MPEPTPRLTDLDPGALLAWAEHDPDSYYAAVHEEAEAMVAREIARHRAGVWRTRALWAEIVLVAAYVLVGIVCVWAVIT